MKINKAKLALQGCSILLILTSTLVESWSFTDPLSILIVAMWLVAFSCVLRPAVLSRERTLTVVVVFVLLFIALSIFSWQSARSPFRIASCFSVLLWFQSLLLSTEEPLPRKISTDKS